MLSLTFALALLPSYLLGSMNDVSILEETGNDFCNAVYEANLSRDDFDKQLVVKDEEEEDERRAKFVKHKYKKRKYFDDAVYHQLVLAALQRKHQERIEQLENKQRESTKEKPSLGHEAMRGVRRSCSGSGDKREVLRRSSSYKLPESSKASPPRSLHSSFSASSGEGKTEHRSSKDDAERRGSTRSSGSSSSKQRGDRPSYDRTDSARSHKSHRSDRPSYGRTDSARSHKSTSSRSSYDRADSARSNKSSRNEHHRSGSSRSLAKHLERTDSSRSCKSSGSKQLDRADSAKSFKSSTSSHSPVPTKVRSITGAPAQPATAVKIESNFMAGLGLAATPTPAAAGHVKIESNFMTGLGLGAATTVHEVPAFLSEAEEDSPQGKRRNRRNNDRNCESDNEGMPATPLRRRLSNKGLASLAEEQENTTEQVVPRMRRRLSNKGLNLASGNASSGESEPPTPRLIRRMSNPNLLAKEQQQQSAPMTPKLRRRLSNPNLLAAEQSTTMTPRMRRRLSNPNLLAKEQQAAAPMTPKLRRRMSNPNLMANAEQSTTMTPRMRRRLSNPNLLARECQTSGDDSSAPKTPRLRRRLSNPSLTAAAQQASSGGEPPGFRRRRSKTNLVFAHPNPTADDDCKSVDSNDGGSRAPPIRRRLSKKSLALNGTAGSDDESKAPPIRRRLSKKQLALNNAASDNESLATASTDRARRCRPKRTGSNPNLMSSGNASFTSADESEGEYKPRRGGRRRPQRSSSGLNEMTEDEEPVRPIARKKSDPKLSSLANADAVSAVPTNPAYPSADQLGYEPVQVNPESDNDKQSIASKYSVGTTNTTPSKAGSRAEQRKIQRAMSGNNLSSLFMKSMATAPPTSQWERDEKRKVQRAMSGNNLASLLGGSGPSTSNSKKLSTPSSPTSCLSMPPTDLFSNRSGSWHVDK